ncbi:MAG: CoA pyrophosphatase [Desulfurellaceae bacterium]|nr:CoA pyrophosphatase [Desulfurellaceae bacterium]
MPHHHGCDGLSAVHTDLLIALGTRLRSRTRIVDDDQSAKRAAVLVPFFEREGGYHLLFTLRTSNMPTHKGDVSFPGGRADKKDASLLHTALRESEEELGLYPSDVQQIGPLDDLRTMASNYVVTPYVGVIPYPYDFQPNAWEVAEIFSVPFTFLADRGNLNAETWLYDGATIPVQTYRYQGYKIWGATQRIIENVLDILKVP